MMNLTSAFQRIALAFVFFRRWMTNLFVGCIDSGAPRPYKVYAFNESDVGLFHELFRAKDLDLETVRNSIPWERYRIEVRYHFRGKKFRCVYRHDDDQTFPPPRRIGLILAPSLVQACLVRRKDGKEIEVTRRVAKYMGPERDFFKKRGLRVSVRDMFPFDDHDDNADRFSRLMLWLSDGKCLSFDYATDQTVSV